MNLEDYLRDGLAVLLAPWHLRQASQVGRRVRVWGRPAIRIRGGKLVIGDQVVLMSTIATLELIVEDGLLDIGARTFVNYGCSIAATQLVRIGSDCRIGKHSILLDNDFHSLDPARRNYRPPSAPVILEENVWLGSRVIVLPGVTIGAHSVIGAGSVVTRNVPPRCLAVGSPAKVIRSL